MEAKFNGIENEKAIKALSEEEQAEKKLYRHPNGNIGFPGIWFRGCLIAEYERTAANKTKTITKERVSPRIKIEPFMIDSGLNDYEVYVRSISSGSRKSGTRTMCVNPVIQEWTASGTLITTLDETKEDLKRKLNSAGENIGVGGNRINGYGRFTVIEFDEVK